MQGRTTYAVSRVTKCSVTPHVQWLATFNTVSCRTCTGSRHSIQCHTARAVARDIQYSVTPHVPRHASQNAALRRTCRGVRHSPAATDTFVNIFGKLFFYKNARICNLFMLFFSFFFRPKIIPAGFV